MQPVLYLSNPEVIVRQLPRRDRRDARVWKVEGTLVRETAAAIRFLADEIVSGCEGLCLDLTHVEFVDGAAMSILRRMQAEGVRITGRGRIPGDTLVTDSSPPSRLQYDAILGGAPRRYLA